METKVGDERVVLIGDATSYYANLYGPDDWNQIVFPAAEDGSYAVVCPQRLLVGQLVVLRCKLMRLHGKKFLWEVYTCGE